MPASWATRASLPCGSRDAAGAQLDNVVMGRVRRALEGELARTIATIGEVAGARVHSKSGRDGIWSFGPM